METTAVNVKEEDTVPVVATADAVEEDNFVKEQPQNGIQEENVPDDESRSQQETDRGDGDEDHGEVTKHPAGPAEPVVPVTVDDDINNPQYIPRRGRFYEHDDRMAYSTTSSEGAESDNGFEKGSGDDDGVSDRQRIRRRHASIKKQKSATPEDTSENTDLAYGDGTLTTKKDLAIKVAGTIKDTENGGPSVSSSSTNTKNYFNRSYTKTTISKRNGTQVNRDSPTAHSNFFNRRPPQNSGGPSVSSSSTNTKSYLNQSPTDSPIRKGNGAQVNRDSPTANSNFFNRRPQQDSGRPSVSSSSTNTKSYLNRSPTDSQIRKGNGAQVNRDSPTVNSNFFNRRPQQDSGRPSVSSSSTNAKNYSHRSPTDSPIRKGNGTQVNRDSPTVNSNFFNRNRQYKNKNQRVEPPTPNVRSSKRYLDQTRKELPRPVLNVGKISETQPPPPREHNELVMQDHQMQPEPQQLLQQQPPTPLEIQQYHQLLQQMHNGMCLDENSDMTVVTAADPSMYHRQSAENENAGAQAAVYQPVPTGATGVTSPPSGTQSLQQPIGAWLLPHFKGLFKEAEEVATPHPVHSS